MTAGSRAAPGSGTTPDKPVGLDPPAWLARGFIGYARRYVRRHHSTVAVHGLERLPVDHDAPLVVYMTHASWWDPMIATVLAGNPLGRRWHRGVIDAASLARYPLLERLGFVGLPGESDEGGAGGSREAARRFLRLADSLSRRPGATLWLTPQGRFTDPRERPLRLRPGLAHLARRLPDAQLVPLAIEYPAGEERLPRVRARIGSPHTLATLAADGIDVADVAAVDRALSAELESTADTLASDVVACDDTGYTALLEGRFGVSPAYDLLRRTAARWRGERYEARHGSAAGTAIGERLRKGAPR